MGRLGKGLCFVFVLLGLKRDSRERGQCTGKGIETGREADGRA